MLQRNCPSFVAVHRSLITFYGIVAKVAGERICFYRIHQGQDSEIVFPVFSSLQQFLEALLGQHGKHGGPYGRSQNLLRAEKKSVPQF